MQLSCFNASPELAQWVTDTLRELQGQAQRLADENNRNLDAIRQKDLKIQALALELAHIRRMRYGKKSEEFSPEQRELFQETWDTDLAAVEAEVEQLGRAPAAKAPRRAHPGRQALPDHLLRIEYRHEPDSCACGQCGSALTKIGEDISEQLDVEPARFFVNRHIRPQE